MIHKILVFTTILIALMMFSQGVVLIVYPQSGGGASLSALVWIYQGSSETAGLVLITTTLLAFTAYTNRAFIGLLIPQLVIGFIYASGSITAVIKGMYADNYVPTGGSQFIYNDQIGWIVLFIIHSVFVTLQLYE